MERETSERREQIRYNAAVRTRTRRRKINGLLLRPASDEKQARWRCVIAFDKSQRRHRAISGVSSELLHASDLQTHTEIRDESGCISPPNPNRSTSHHLNMMTSPAAVGSTHTCTNTSTNARVHLHVHALLTHRCLRSQAGLVNEL